MVVRSLEVNNDLFHLKEDNEELFDLKVTYLSTIDVLLYLTNCTRSNKPFSVNLLEGCSFALTQRN